MVKNKLEDAKYRALTVQALQMRNEIFSGDGMCRETFTDIYLNGIGKYEKKIAKEEGIEISNEE